MQPTIRSNPVSQLRAGLFGLMVAVLAAIAPANAAQVNVGVLTCKVAGGTGFVFGSTKELECKFEGIDGAKEAYYGSIEKYGVDLGFTGSSYMVWTVFAPSQSVPSGALAGSYGGVSAEATVGLGVGANALVGGLEHSIALQPLSGQLQEGLNLAVGISQLQLHAAH